MGLSRTIMTVLNLRGESALKGHAPAKEAETRETPTTEKADAELSSLVSTAQFIRRLYLADSGGRLLGVGHADRALHDPPADLSPVLQSFARAGLGGELKRAFLETGNGIAAVLRVADDRWLVVMCEKGASLGTVSVGVGKLLARLVAPPVNGKPVNGRVAHDLPGEIPGETAGDPVPPPQLHASEV